MGNVRLNNAKVNKNWFDVTEVNSSESLKI